MLCTVTAAALIVRPCRLRRLDPPPASGPSAFGGAASGEADFTIGIVQYTQHSSLDEICEALQRELEPLALTTEVKLNVIVKTARATRPPSTTSAACSWPTRWI